jgi:hypothetical protein
MVRIISIFAVLSLALDGSEEERTEYWQELELRNWKKEEQGKEGNDFETIEDQSKDGLQTSKQDKRENHQAPGPLPKSYNAFSTTRMLTYSRLQPCLRSQGRSHP